MTEREMARAHYYALYREPGYKSAARKIDDAVGKAAKKVLQKTKKGVKLERAMAEALEECVQPVMTTLADYGASDTEPEWMVVDTLKELVEQAIGTAIEVDGMSLRFSL